MWKDAKCIMLPTNKAMWPNCIWLGRITKKLRLDTSYNDNPKTKEPVDNTMLCQHLYIISPDEEIKEGDWIYYSITNVVLQWNGNTPSRKEDKKVIATTDSFLMSIKGQMKMGTYFPQISQQFIEEYIEKYNQGNVIENVEVEYDNDVEYWAARNMFNPNSIDFKVYTLEEKNKYQGVQFDYYPTKFKISKDNFISLRRKETKLYTREEVVKLINELQNIPIIVENQLTGRRMSSRNWEFDNQDNWFDDWIQQNL